MIDARTNAAAVAAALDRYTAMLPRVIFQASHSWALRSANELRKKSPTKEVTDGISGSAKATSDGGADIIVRSAKKIGVFVEYGTGLYGPRRKLIVAKGGPFVDAKGRKRKRRMLRWETREGGVVYAESVKGARARPWFWPVMKRRVNDFQAQLTKAMQRHAAACMKRAGIAT